MVKWLVFYTFVGTLQRFEHSSTSAKIKTSIDFPARLNIAPYLSSTIVRKYVIYDQLHPSAPSPSRLVFFFLLSFLFLPSPGSFTRVLPFAGVYAT